MAIDLSIQIKHADTLQYFHAPLIYKLVISVLAGIATGLLVYFITHCGNQSFGSIRYPNDPVDSQSIPAPHID